MWKAGSPRRGCAQGTWTRRMRGQRFNWVLRTPRPLPAILRSWHLYGRWRLGPYLDFRHAVGPNALQPNFGDLWFLYQQIVQRHPHTVLELGSGYSTAIVAQALYTLGRGQVVSMETNPFWARHSRSILPPHLRAICTVKDVTVLEGESGAGCGIRYRPPLPAADVVYVDGPEGKGLRQRPLELVERPSPCVIVDRRWETVTFLR